MHTTSDMAHRAIVAGPARSPQGEAGFSLLEVMVAMTLLGLGLLGVAQVFYVGLSVAATSSPALVAREKAREAIESVHTARDTHTVTWAQIRNVSAPAAGICPAGSTGQGGGIFNGADLALRAPGPDGLVNTGDDTGAESSPGPDNILGTADDVPLLGFSRQVNICDIDGNTDLRAIVVTVRFNGSGAVGERRRNYRLITYISKFS